MKISNMCPELNHNCLSNIDVTIFEVYRIRNRIHIILQNQGFYHYKINFGCHLQYGRIRAYIFEEYEHIKESYGSINNEKIVPNNERSNEKKVSDIVYIEYCLME